MQVQRGIFACPAVFGLHISIAPHDSWDEHSACVQQHSLAVTAVPYADKDLS